MILDGHIHINEGTPEPAKLRSSMHAADVEGGVLLSLRPASFNGAMETPSPQARLDNLFAWAEAGETFYPFFWIDPTETDAVQQVETALNRSIAGFKVICGHFMPGDPRAMRTYRAIAEADKPILFHSGILFDTKPSGQYTRPVNFEALIDVPGLRFALAHISWPWVDECIAVYGKYRAARRRKPDLDVEMFIDTTPGTPQIYRKDALTKLISYNAESHVFFGSDNHVNPYRAEYAAEWLRRDAEILGELDVSPETREAIFSKNLERFLGVAGDA